jgi:hypothetical protein
MIEKTNAKIAEVEQVLQEDEESESEDEGATPTKSSNQAGSSPTPKNVTDSRASRSHANNSRANNNGRDSEPLKDLSIESLKKDSMLGHSRQLSTPVDDESPEDRAARKATTRAIENKIQTKLASQLSIKVEEDPELDLQEVI